MKKQLWLLGIITLAIVVIKIAFLNLYSEWLWFDAFGKAALWQQIFQAKTIIFLLFSSVSLFFLGINYAIAQKIVVKMKSLAPNRFNNPLADALNSLFSASAQMPLKLYRAILFLGMILVSVGIGISAQNQWQTIFAFFNQTAFQLQDPIFHKDISFFIFSLPYFQLIYQLLLAILVVSIGLSIWIYFSNQILALIANTTLKTNAMKTHLFILMSLGLAVIAFGRWLKTFSILYSQAGIVFGAGFTDINAVLPAYWLIFILTGITAILFLIGAFRKTIIVPCAALVILIAVSFIGTTLMPTLVQKLVVAPNELQKEKPFITNNIQLTRAAYGLNQIQDVEFPGKDTLTYKDIQNQPGVINNIRLWNPSPLKQTMSQLQEMRPYYQFLNIDDDRYSIQNTLRQVYLSARELDVEQLPIQAKTWVNSHLIYTHGYGLCMSPVNMVSAEGLPHFFIKDLPPTSSMGITMTRPEIYFGEKTVNYVLVNTLEKEFNYPQGNTNVYTHYESNGGIVLNTWLKRIIFSIKFSDFNLLISPQVTQQSRLLYNRDIRSIAYTLAPFLRFDNDPYLVVSESGRLIWIMDAYTTSAYFPYSEPITRNRFTAPAFNYIRNSVKITIDAYTGAINLYIADSTDPIIRTLAKIYPSLFEPISNMPRDIQAHIRYPKDLFTVQAAMLRTYHMTDPQVFYNREDTWDFPRETIDGTEQTMPAYYMVTKLPEDQKESFVLMLPFTPKGKNNMIAWLSVKCDPETYGKARVYKFSKERTVYGPVQIDSRIDQDTEISQKLTLWGQSGSRVIRGNLMVIPVNDSIIYIEPIYLQSTQSKLPEFKRIIFSYNDRIVMAETLDSAIQTTFSDLSAAKSIKTDESTPKPTNITALIQTLANEFQAFKAQLKQNNWIKSGEKMQAVDQLIQNLVKYSNTK